MEWNWWRNNKFAVGLMLYHIFSVISENVPMPTIDNFDTTYYNFYEKKIHFSVTAMTIFGNFFNYFVNISDIYIATKCPLCYLRSRRCPKQISNNNFSVWVKSFRRFYWFGFVTFFEKRPYITYLLLYGIELTFLSTAFFSYISGRTYGRWPAGW